MELVFPLEVGEVLEHRAAQGEEDISGEHERGQQRKHKHKHPHEEDLEDVVVPLETDHCEE